MKLTAFILLVACLQVTAKGFTQTVTLSLKNVPLENAFREIKKQTGYEFLYTDEMIQKSRPISISVKDVSLTEALNECFRNQPLGYAIIEKTIVVKPKEKSPNEQTAAEPPIDVKGRVVNEKGEPVIATVTVKGTNISTSTNDNGEFELKGIDANAILVITGVNIETREVKLNGRSDLATITAKTKISEGEEVLLSTGYWTTAKKTNTGNISKITAATIEKQPVANPLEALQGRVAGIYINQNSGIPGTNFEVRIRGINSISSGNNPFYVIDGVPFISQSLSDVNTTGSLYFSGVSPLYSINPDDIESIEILKDADATAIYGSRGANGVILITTKKGKSGKVKFDLNVKSGFSQVGHMLDLLKTEPYITMRMEAVYNDGDTGPRPDEYDINGAWDKTRYTDWQKVLIGGKAKMTSLNAAISGGGKETQFLFGAGYDDQGVVFPGDHKAKRFSNHFSITHSSVNKKFNAKLLSSYIVNTSNIVSADLTGVAIELPPNAPKLYDDDGRLNWGGTATTSFTWKNPISHLENRFNSHTYNLITKLELGYEIYKELRIKINIGLNDIRNEETRTYSSDANPPSLNNPANSRLDVGDGTNRSWIVEPQLNWEKTIGRGKLAILAGATYQKSISEASREIFRGFPSNALIHDPRSAASVTQEVYNYTEYRYAAVYGRVNYNHEEKYIMNITGRRDGSSRFGPGRQYANLGAAGIAWIFSNEGFIKNKFSFLSFGKIRASYGITGNDQISDYKYLEAYRAGSQYQGSSTLFPTQLFNPDYGWETNKKLEGALELGFLRDRLLFSASYYLNRSSNQLVNYRLAGTSGYSSVLKNFPATVRNTGLELELNTVNINHKRLKWMSSLNFTFPRNKLVSFPDIEKSSYANIYIVGQPLNITRSLHYLGVDATTGLYQFEDVNHDGIISPDDYIDPRVTVINKQNWYGGFNNNFSYKGLEVDIFFQFVGQRGLQFTSSGTPGSYFTNQPADIFEGRWRNPGDEPTRQYFSRSQAAFTAQGRFNASNALSADISFARLKNMSVSYQLPDKLLKEVRGRVFLQGQNLFTISKYDGLDPETGNNFLPPLTTFVAGLQVSF